MEKKATVLNLGLLITALVLVLIVAVPVYAAPPSIVTTTLSVPENSGTDFVVGKIVANNPNSQWTTEYEIIGGTGGDVNSPVFSMDKDSGVVTVKNGAALDYETTKSFTLLIRVTARPPLGNQNPAEKAEKMITVNVLDQPDETPEMEDQTFNVAENTPNNQPVGMIVFTDKDETDSHTFTITAGNGTGGGAFKIMPTGQIQVNDSNQLNYESLIKQFILDVTIEDSGGNPNTAKITINVTDVNEPPIVTDQSFTIAENSTNGTVVGTIVANDPDTVAPNNIITFSIPAGGAFAVNANNGELTVANSALLNFEATQQFKFVVTVADQGGASATATITVNLTNVNDPPRVTGNGIADVIVNAGTPSATRNLYEAFEDDDHADNQLAFVIEKNNNPSMFSQSTISNGILTLSFADGAVGEATITIRATDPGGLFVEDTFKVFINSAPVSTGPISITVDEDADPYLVYLYGLFDDYEEEQSQLTYTIPLNGVINGTIFTSYTIVKPNLRLEFKPDAHGQATITVRATDAAGLWAETVVSVKVNPVNDEPTTTGITDVKVSEGAPPTTINLFEHFNDKEDDPKQLTYAVMDNSNEDLFESVTVNAQQATLTLTYKPFASGEATLKVRATDKGIPGVPNSSRFIETTFKVTVDSVNDAPTVTSFSRTTDEDKPYNFKLSDFTSNFSDPDGDDLANILIMTLPANGKLLLGDAVVTVNQNIPAVQLDTLAFEPDTNWGGDSTSFQWNGSDGESYAATPATVTIAVTALNDAPTLTDVVMTGLEGISINFQVSDFTGAFFDVDGDSLQMVRIVTVPKNGTLRLGNNNVNANDQINAGVLGQLRYVPNQFFNGQDSFLWNGSDGQVFSNQAAQVILNVEPENDPPVLDLNGGQAGVNFQTTFVAGGPPVAITGQNLTLTDVDSDTMEYATVIVIEPKNGAKEELSADTTGTNIKASLSMSGSNRMLQLDGPAPIADFVKVLKTVKYRILPDVTNPDTSERSVQFNVYDGEDNSNDAFAKIAVINPRIEITVSPSIQPVARGGTAAFTINVKNTGAVDLKNIFITSEQVPACNRGGDGFETLAAGKSLPAYVCLVPNVQGRIDNLVKVTATDVIVNSTVTDDDTGVVRVPRQMAIDIASVAGVGNILVKGQDAQFVVTILNPSEIDLTDVQVKAFINYDLAAAIASPTDNVPAPACDKTIGSLPAGKESKFNCTIPNVQQSFKIEVQVTGLIDELIQTDDFDIETVSVLNLTLDAFSSPFEIPTGTATEVEYSMTLANASIAPLTLTSLSSSLHGNLLDPANNAVSDNSCTGLALAVPPGEVRTCSYRVMVNAVPPLITNVITAAAEDEGGRVVNVSDSAIVSVGDFAALEVNLTAAPNTIVAPSGTVNITVRVANNTGSALTLDSLADSKLGNLHGQGNCELPRQIGANAEYTCIYSADITGQAGSTDTRTVTARADSLQATDTVDIRITATSQLTIMLPSVAKMSRAGEPNNGACSAMAISANMNNYFYADDNDDWYKFQVSAAGDVRIRLTNFLATEGQLLIYTGTCTNPSRIGHNGDRGVVPNREIVLSNLQPGTTYYIWVLAKEGLDSSAPYNLYVQTTP